VNTSPQIGPWLAEWRLKGIGPLRITFGVVWAIDAWFKWQPGFINDFADYQTTKPSPPNSAG
jgi:hypothetical protein